MLFEFATIFSLVFLMEVGDKTSLLVIALSSKSKMPLYVFLGSILGLGLISVIGIFIGHYISSFKINSLYISVISGSLFILIGILLLLDRSVETVKVKIASNGISWFWISFTGIILAELFDKSQLVIISLAIIYPYYIVFTATLSAFILLIGIEVKVGDLLSKYITGYLLKIIGGLLFIGYGFYSLVTAVY